MKACHSKPIVIVSPSGEIASYFESPAEAARILSLSKACIQRALRTGNFYLRRKWVYEEAYREKWMSGRHHEYAYDYDEQKRQAISNAYNRRTLEQRQATQRRLSEKAKKRYAESDEHPFRAIHRALRKPIICKTTNERFDSLISFARKYNVHPSQVSRAIRDKKAVKEMYVSFE